MFKKLTLPKAFEEKIRGHALESKTLEVLHNASTLLGDPTSGLPFFPEFTEHGPPHFQRVLDASASVLNNEALSKITPEDVYVLTSAVVLHDVAMHLKEDGFIKIATGSWSGASDWPELWKEFTKEAGRWNAKKLNEVLGSRDNIVSITDLSIVAKTPIPLENPDCWTGHQRKLIGEFIRRHHATLAQEFAVFGFPGPGEPVWIIAESCKYAYLAGLIAKSHHLHLRDTFSTLEERFHTRTFCFNTLPVLLMAALRIADYLDVKSVRAPCTSLSLRRIRNPISAREWKSHESIVDVRVDQNDSEAIFVMATPSDVETYLRLRELLTDLQKELDMSWAVLGEVFSRQSDLNSVGLSIRRVASNFDNDKAYRKTVEFIPRRFHFHTDSAKLLNKLVGPLYENRIEVGVRELLQNAIDATNELQALNGESPKPIKITVEENNDAFLFRIEDFGIGMTEDVLHNYFLCAGASFRDSDDWKRNFKSGDTPKFARIGRFGVGCLAAFLLGERISVTTRHYQANEDQALTFSAEIDDDFLELRKTRRQKSGTTISIEIPECIYKELCKHDGLEWDWYRWKCPQIERHIVGRASLPRVTQVPMPGDALPDEWHELRGTEFESVLWTHGKGAPIICNGLNIGNSASSKGNNRSFTWNNKIHIHDLTTPISRPKVSIFDSRGLLPITLQRFSTVGDSLPFLDELLADVTRDFIAFNLVCAPNQPPQRHNSFLFRDYLSYPGDTTSPWLSFVPAGPWFYSKDGSGVQHVTSLRNLAPSKVLLLIAFDHRVRTPVVPFREDTLYFFGLVPLLSHSREMAALMALAHALGFKINDIGYHPRFFSTCEEATVFFRSDISQVFDRNASEQVDLGGAKYAPVEGGIDAYFKTTGAAPTLNDLPPEVHDGVRQGAFMAAVIKNPCLEISTNPIFAQVWTEYMEGEIIPYDEVRREDKFKKAYQDLTEFIRKWKSLKAQGSTHIQDLFRTVGPQGEQLRL